MRQFTKLKLMALGFLLGFSTVASAQSIFFGPSFFYRSLQTTNEGVEGERTETFYDIKLGALMDSGLYFGGIYSQMNNDYGSSDDSRTSYGASVGYMQAEGWFAMLHYFISSEFERSSTVTDKGGSGFQADFGYLFNLGSNFVLGPQLTYKNLTYTERDTGSVTVDLDDTTYTDLLPMVALGVKF